MDLPLGGRAAWPPRAALLRRLEPPLKSRWGQGLAVALLLVSAAAPAHAWDLPDYASVRAQWRPSDVRVLAANGHVIQRIRTDFSSRRGDWVPLDRISAALQRAIVQSEDHRFYSHAGVDWLATASAAWSYVAGDAGRGASTISMQLAAMLDDELRRGAGGRGIWQKFDQMEAARSLEAHWSKPHILEAYLNLAAFRGELVGVDSLSRVMFQKRPSGLTLREASLAAVLLRGPNAPVATLTERSCRLLQKLGRPQACSGLRGFVQAALTRVRRARFGTPGLARHWGRELVRRGDVDDQGVVHSTLDEGLQRRAVQSVHQHLTDLRGTGVTDAAVVVLDNRSGAVLAYVGSSGELSDAWAVDHAQALRQAGSTLKPFLYAMALDTHHLTAASLLDDRPVDLDGGSGLYVPDNYDHRFSGWVSVRTALASSLNVPAVRTLMMVTPQALARRLVALGLPLKHAGDYYGYSLALGSADVTLLSLTNAYRTLANGGRFAPVGTPVRDGRDRDEGQAEDESLLEDGDLLFSPQAAWVVGNILSDRQARARTFGLDSPLSTRSWTAAKTGTSRDMRDNWTVGWSADYTVGVWVGNSEGASMRNISGVTGAGPIWHDLFAWLYRHQAGHPPPRPSGITSQRVRFGAVGEAGLEPSRMEYFLGDTAQPAFVPPDDSDVPGQPRIAEPVDGTIIALDPDIPWSHQRMRLRAVDAASHGVPAARWFVDGEAYGRGDRLSWAPRPGTHDFSLRDAGGRVLDEARVIVREGRFKLSRAAAGGPGEPTGERAGWSRH